MKNILVCIVCAFYFACFSAGAEPTSTDLAIAAGAGNIELIRQYLDAGGDPNQRLPPQSFVGAENGRRVFGGGPSTLLGIATLHNHVDLVELLLERGADPNQYSQEATPLVFNLLNISSICSPMDEAIEELSAAGPSPRSQYGPHFIKDTTLREQALAPLRNIRELLLARGAISDWAPYFRRKEASEFQQFLAAHDDHVTYALCSSDRIIFQQTTMVQQFEIPTGINEDVRIWFALKKKLAEWLDTQTHNGLLRIAIIGPKDMRESVLWGLESLCEKKNIPVSLYVIPHTITCDAATLLKAFTDPTHAQSDVMDILNEFCPGQPINPFTEEVETKLRTL